jgi:hypothetical protein
MCFSSILKKEMGMTAGNGLLAASQRGENCSAATLGFGSSPLDQGRLSMSANGEIPPVAKNAKG